MHIRKTLALLIASVATSALAAPSTLIRDVRVFDGTRALGTHSVLIDGDRIVDVNFKGKAPTGATIVDGKGKTLLPALIDAHVHAYQGQDDALLFGVATQLDMFSAPQSTQPIRDRMKRRDNANAADIYTSGILATVPKGHGTEYGFPIPTLTTPGEAQAWVDARIAEGSDYIKIIDEPGRTIGRPMPTLDVPTIRAIVAAAHKRGKLAVVHVQSLATATDAVEAGADGLAHLFTDKDGGDAFARLAGAHHIFVVPTYVVFEGFAGRAGSTTLLDHPGLSGLLPASAQSTIRQSFGTDRSARLDTVESANIAALLRAGVPILAGTDAGNPGTWYGLSLHRELELLVKAGLTPVQALSAATANSAKAFRLADRGRIAPGLRADLLLVGGDPTTNIAAVHDILEIWKDGQAVSPLRAARRSKLAAAGSGAAAIALPPGGRISAFAAGVDGKPVLTSPVGAGWFPSTDSIAGGKSTVALTVAQSAPGGQSALVMTGEIKPEFMAPWAGISFNPGVGPFQAVSLGDAKTLRFQARGKGSSFVVMGFSTAGGRLPSVLPISVTSEWHEVAVKLSDLKGFDTTNALLLLIGAAQTPGPFKLEIADVRLTGE